MLARITTTIYIFIYQIVADAIRKPLQSLWLQLLQITAEYESWRRVPHGAQDILFADLKPRTRAAYAKAWASFQQWSTQKGYRL